MILFRVCVLDAHAAYGTARSLTSHTSSQLTVSSHSGWTAFFLAVVISPVLGVATLERVNEKAKQTRITIVDTSRLPTACRTPRYEPFTRFLVFTARRTRGPKRSARVPHRRNSCICLRCYTNGVQALDSSAP